MSNPSSNATEILERRPAGRAPDALRPLTLTADPLRHPEGSAEIWCGQTRVICTASVETDVPRFAKEEGIGWVTAEYAMLPRATTTRGRRGGGGRAKEISRLIGRTLRQAVELPRLVGYQITIDCDVLQADGGTRTAAITGGYVALALAINRLVAAGKLPANALREPVAAVSVGMIGDVVLLDLDYPEDSTADVDLNVAMTASGGFIELQGTAEGKPYRRDQLDGLLDVAARGIEALAAEQRKVIAGAKPRPA